METMTVKELMAELGTHPEHQDMKVAVNMGRAEKLAPVKGIEMVGLFDDDGEMFQMYFIRTY